MTRADADSPLEIMWSGKYVVAYRRGRWEFAGRARNIGAVVILAECDEGVILVEQMRVGTGRRCLELPAGLVGDEDEQATIEATAIRELEEETGFTASGIEQLGEFYSSPGMLAEAFTLVRATGVKRVGSGGGSGDEDITVHVVPRGEVPAFIERKRGEGLGMDVKLLLLLGPSLLQG